MQVFQNDLSTTVKLLPHFTLIFTHLACLHSGQDHLFFPTEVITCAFLLVTHFPSAPIFHIIIFIKNEGKMLVGFGNIATLASVCMPFSVCDSPVSFFPGWSNCFWLSSSWRQNFLRSAIFLNLTCRFSVSSDLGYQTSRKSSVETFPLFLR